MKKTRTGEVAGERDGFFFLGNHLALDFLNTRPVLNGELVELLPDFGSLLRWFQAAGLLTLGQTKLIQRRWGRSAKARETVEDIRQLREKLRSQVIPWEEGKLIQPDVVTELNRLMNYYPIRTRLLNSPPTTELWFEPRTPEELFAPLAHGAAMLFAEVDLKRVRKCANCVLHFQDTSKKGTRRWCSMQFCGNRAKVAAYAARRRRRVQP